MGRRIAAMRIVPGIKRVTSRTRRKYHATRPNSPLQTGVRIIELRMEHLCLGAAGALWPSGSGVGLLGR